MFEPGELADGDVLDTDTLDGLVEWLRDTYPERYGQLASEYPRQTTLRIEWDDLYAVEPDLADDYLTEPAKIQPELNRVLRSVPNPTGDDLDGAAVRVGGLPSSSHLRVADVRHEHFGQYVALHADLNNVGVMQSRYQSAAFECIRCGKVTHVEQRRREATEHPHQCSGCERQGPFRHLEEDSVMLDYRVCELRDPPSIVSGGTDASVHAYFEGEDVAMRGGEGGLAAHAGEEVVVYGRMLALPEKTKQGDLVAKEYFVAEAIDFEASSYSEEDIAEHRAEFESLAGEPDIFDRVADSISPQLEGDEYDEVKTGAWMYLFGAPRVETDEASFRGDIHMLLPGDPATGKSTLGRGLASLSPRGRRVSGNTTTGVGLTATATQDEFTGKWALVPGVLPKASGGHVIIDELDKADGDAIEKLHEALEEGQRIDVAKASVQATLRTECGVFATANPEGGRFDRELRIGEQIDIDPALIDRFDLVFPLQDYVDEERDTMIARSITESAKAATAGQSQRDIPTEVLRAWVAFARDEITEVTPTPEAEDMMVEFYNEMRQLNDDGKTVPVTPRKLRSTWRLAGASARLRLSDTIEVEDVERAKPVLRRVVGATAFDPATGQFDASRIDEAGTKARTQEDRVEAIIDIVGAADDGMRMGEIQSVAEDEFGIEPSKTKSIVRRLREHGELYEPNEEGRYHAV